MLILGRRGLRFGKDPKNTWYKKQKSTGKYVNKIDLRLKRMESEPIFLRGNEST